MFQDALQYSLREQIRHKTKCLLLRNIISLRTIVVVVMVERTNGRYNTQATRCYNDYFDFVEGKRKEPNTLNQEYELMKWMERLDVGKKKYSNEKTKRKRDHVDLNHLRMKIKVVLNMINRLYMDTKTKTGLKKMNYGIRT
jgi:hypothetical protein